MTGKEYDSLLQLAETFEESEGRAIEASVKQGDFHDGRSIAYKDCAAILRYNLRKMVQDK